MAQSRLEVVTLIQPVALTGAGGDVFKTSATIDLRTNIERVEAVVAQGTASGESKPVYQVRWAGGILTTEIGGTPTGQPDAFEPFTDPTFPVEKILIDNQTQNPWPISVPMPAVLWPFIRFQLQVVSGSPAGTLSLYAIVRKQFGS